jgi:hypothetical protein
MGQRDPQPLCRTRVGDKWIDEGTTCRSRSTKPGPIRDVVLVRVVLDAVPPLKANLDGKLVDSKAPEPAGKPEVSPLMMKNPIYAALLKKRS